MDTDIQLMCESCDKCIKYSKSSANTLGLTWELALAPMDRIHIDFAEYKSTYFLIIVDAYSRWLEVYKVMNMTTDTTTYYLNEFFSRYGLPKVIVSDNGPQFSGYGFQEFCKIHYIKHKTIPPYHPQTNGLAEKYVQILKQFLRKKNSLSKLDINRFLFWYRNTLHYVTYK